MCKKYTGAGILLGVAMLTCLNNPLSKKEIINATEANLPVLRPGDSFRKVESEVKKDRALTLKIAEELKKDEHLNLFDVSNTNAVIWFSMDNLFTEEYIQSIMNGSKRGYEIERELFKYDEKYIDAINSKVNEWLYEQEMDNALTSRPFRGIEKKEWNGRYYIFIDFDGEVIDGEVITDDFYGKIKKFKKDNSVSSNVSTKLLSTSHKNIDHPDIVNNVATTVVERFEESREDLDHAIRVKAPNLVGITDALIENYEDYGISPYFQLAVFSLESGYGTSKLAREKNNIAGLNAYPTSSKSIYQNAFGFKSKSDCVDKFGDIMGSKTYLGRGIYSLDGIANIYCPTDKWNWKNQVSKLVKEYKAIAKA